MRKIYTLFIALSFTTVATYATVQTTKHTIKNGETLYTIAHKNHTTIEEVRKANGLKKGETLKLGRVLKVPQNTYFPNKKTERSIVHKSMKKKSKSKMAKHIIKKGETLYTIAHKNHTTIEEVRKANGLKKGETLKLGRVLKVPQNTYFPNKKVMKAKVVKKSFKKSKIKLSKYRIKRGDTLSSIAVKYHTTVKKLLASNHMKKNDKLKLGKTLKIPTSKKASFKRVRLTKVKKKKSNKRLVASLSKLESVKLTKKKTLKKKSSFSLGDIFFSSKKSINKSTKITSLAKKKLGRRYVWGASGDKNTFDCSGFTTYVYKKNGIKLPRRAIAQSKYGKYVSRKNLKKGDLIFFDTSKHHKGYVNHVGIYLGNGKFIHASSAKKKVVITSLNKKFYSQRYKGARRPS
jgi:cell wall-associated NlpC family hydrolase